MTKAAYDEAARDALRLTSGLIERHGPRVSGTEGCRGAALELEALLAESCDEAHSEPFGIHPGSLFAIGKVFALSYLVGAASLFPGSAPFLGIGLLAMLLGAAFCVAQFILYSDTFDRLFKKVEGRNIVGSIEPSGPALRQVILVAHHDSAPVYPFHERWPALYPLRLFLPIALFALCFLALCAAASVFLFTGRAPIQPPWVKLALALGTVLVAPMYWFISRRPSPGAGDDLIGCAIGIGVAALFGGRAAKLEGTRLVVLLTDGEEVGQKGAKSFIAANRASMARARTTVIDVDSIYAYEELAIVLRDGNGLTRLSGDMARRLGAVAEERGHRPRMLSIPFGGGGTDAAQFARRGIESVGIVADSTALVRKEILFHTMKDLPGRISAKAVGAVIEIVGEYLLREDAGVEDRSGLKGPPSAGP
jgi:aminopeptidase YwaD